MAKINIGTHRNTFLGVFLYVESIYDVYFGNRGRLDVIHTGYGQEDTHELGGRQIDHILNSVEIAK